jgi:dTDP-4-dehydrorhamnose 3,5-epimerase
VNFPTEPYNHEAPDRLMLPWDTDELPVDVSKYLPRS